MSAEAKTLRVLVVDDEKPARDLLREMLGDHGGVEVVGESADGFEAVRAVGDLKPDVVFLDIQMPKLDGFEVLQLIEGEVAVVFVTAYDQYALKAFEVKAVDYLLKPFGEDRLATALERVRTRLGEPPAVTATELAAAAQPEGRGVNRIVIRDGGQIQVIPVDSVDFLVAQGDYVAIHTGGKSHLKQQTLQSLSASLDADRFVRIHRSYVLNLERLARIEPYAKDSRVAVLHNGTELPVSRSGYARLRELLE